MSLVIFGLMRAVLVFTLLAATTAGCAHLPPSAYASVREASYFSENREVLPSIQTAIEQGHVVPGMDREQVWTVLGDPLRRTMFKRERTIEIWLYQGHKLHQDQMRADRSDLFRAVFSDGILVILEPL
jgi:outer membrane protein assembly factor BamE (lipoprotein component of BamABCDE complex)